MNDAGPCACTGVTLDAATLADLRQRYSGCLCLRCLHRLPALPPAGVRRAPVAVQPGVLRAARPRNGRTEALFRRPGARKGGAAARQPHRPCPATAAATGGAEQPAAAEGHQAPAHRPPRAAGQPEGPGGGSEHAAADRCHQLRGLAQHRAVLRADGGTDAADGAVLAARLRADARLRPWQPVPQRPAEPRLRLRVGRAVRHAAVRVVAAPPVSPRPQRQLEPLPRTAERRAEVADYRR
jgi:hypothetical protein